MDVSANEVETLIVKAARGGGLPLGCAEDLATAARYLDLAALGKCPCSGDPPMAMAIQTALDFVMAGEGPKTVRADAALITAFVAAAQTAWQKHLIWTSTDTGAVFERFEERAPEHQPPLGRRAIPADLAAHLKDMASKLLVPESEASRLGGAGAGLTDND